MRTALHTELLKLYQESLSQEGITLTKDQASTAMDAMVDVIEGLLRMGRQVRFHGFGTFYLMRSQERLGTDFHRPGEKVRIPSKLHARFRMGDALDAALNGKTAEDRQEDTDEADT